MAKKATKTAKKKNPPDATLRNVRASNGRDRKLAAKLEAFGTTLHLLSKRIEELERRLGEWDLAHQAATTTDV